MNYTCISENNYNVSISSFRFKSYITPIGIVGLYVVIEIENEATLLRVITN